MTKLRDARKLFLILFISVGLITGTAVTAEAAYSIGFKTPDIEIHSPVKNGLSFNGSLTVEGRTSLPEVWLCVRGPGGEVETYAADITKGEFSVGLYLRFGKGKYTFWAGDNPNRFDGNIRFEVNNTVTEDTRYLAPSAYVDSDSDDIIALAADITGEAATDMEKVQAIHQWVISNIKYDYKAYLERDNSMHTASETIKRGKGICRDYSFTVAALARALNIPAKIVYGNVNGAEGWDPQLHAWNEVYVDERWITIDTTWDAGYIKEGKFIASPSDKYFAPDIKELAKTHQVSSVTVH